MVGNSEICEAEAFALTYCKSVAIASGTGIKGNRAHVPIYAYGINASQLQ
jgi:hypothetical protein